VADLPSKPAAPSPNGINLRADRLSISRRRKFVRLAAWVLGTTLIAGLVCGVPIALAVYAVSACNNEVSNQLAPSP
jgi:hypothetical protein